MIVWEGLPTVLRNLNIEVNKIKNGSLRGLIRSTIIIRRSMDLDAPLIPVDTGNLRSSWFVVTNKATVADGANPTFGNRPDATLDRLRQGHKDTVSKWKTIATGTFPMVAFGFTAFYAERVHEALGTNFKRPNSGAKFFEAAIKTNSKRILNMIRVEAQVKA